MRYTIHYDHLIIGTTHLDRREPRNQRQGDFTPDDAGRELLPAIADILPAINAFGRSAMTRGLDPGSDAAFTALSSHMTHVFMTGPEGEICPFDMLTINDCADVRQAGLEQGVPEGGRLPEIARGQFYFVDCRFASAIATKEMRRIVEEVRGKEREMLGASGGGTVS